MTFLQDVHVCLVRGSYVLQIVCPVLKCPKIRRNKNFIEFCELSMPEQQKLEKWTTFCKS